LTQNRPRNIGAFIRQRLLNLAREKCEAFDLVMTRYGLGRLLYRIGRSEWRTRFLLKGAMLYTLWHDAPLPRGRSMTKSHIKNTAASVRQRLLNKAREAARPFNELLQYYVMERFLYRMAQSHQADGFIFSHELWLLAPKAAG
jgi:hypothetical protein